MIEDARERTAIINLQDGKGYYIPLPEERADVEHWYKAQKSRALRILKTLKKLTENGITSVIIMHDLALALKYCDNFLCITNNQKIIQKNQSEIYDTEILRSIFNMNFEIINKGNCKYVEIID